MVHSGSFTSVKNITKYRILLHFCSISVRFDWLLLDRKDVSIPLVCHSLNKLRFSGNFLEFPIKAIRYMSSSIFICKETQLSNRKCLEAWHMSEKSTYSKYIFMFMKNWGEICLQERNGRIVIAILRTVGMKI